MRLHTLLIVLCAACSTRKAAAPSPDARPAAQVVPVTGALTCARVFPQALRERYFAGATVEERALGADYQIACDMKAGGQVAGGVEVTCHPHVKDSRDRTITTMKNKLHAVDAPGLGEAAVSFDNGAERQISAWDDDSDCHVSVSAHVPGVDLQALAKDLLSSLPPR